MKTPIKNETLIRKNEGNPKASLNQQNQMLENRQNTNVNNSLNQENYSDADNVKKHLNQKNSKNKRKYALGILFLLISSSLIAYAAHWFFYDRFFIQTDNAYVAGNQVQIMPEITGMVNAIYVENTDYVEAGDLLLTLDDADAKQSFEKAKSALAIAVRQINQAQFQLKQNEAVMVQKETELEQAIRDLSRRMQLNQTQAIGKEELQHAQDAVKLAEAAFLASQQNYLANKGLILDTPLAAQPSIIKAATELKEAWLKLERTKITSPVAGYVSRRSVQVGGQVVPSIPLMVIVPSDNFWIEANFKETQLANMRKGQMAQITTDLYGPKIKFSGIVQGIDMGTGSAFSLLPAQNATGNWIKIVQRVPVRIELNPKDLEKYPLRIGLSSQVSVDIRDGSGPHLTQDKTKTEYVSFNHDFDMKTIESLINKIIQDNSADATNNL